MTYRHFTTTYQAITSKIAQPTEQTTVLVTFPTKGGSINV